MTQAGSAARTVILYGREGCCLCDDARELLLRLRRGHPFLLQEFDIDHDERLLRAYLERIPVIEIDGEVVSELLVDEAAIEGALAISRPANPR